MGHLSVVDPHRHLDRKIDHMQPLLAGLCAKGMVLDLWLRDRYYDAVRPFVAGFSRRR